jgi:TP901-1 family phage major tail protein
MAAQKGIDMLLKVSSDGTSVGTMNDLGGMRSSSISFNNSPIDITSADATTRYRQLLAGGIRSVDITGSGVFVDGTSIEDIRDHIMATSETLAYLQFVIPDFGTVAGSFHASSLEFGADHDGEVTFSATFNSAGDVTWAAA